MPDPISALALTAGGAFLGKFFSPAGEALGQIAWERAQKLATKAAAILNEKGRSPEPGDPKIIVPLVEGAALESDETLSDMWAKLLASATDPVPEVKVQLGFVEVLRQLEPTDTTILNWLYLPSKGKLIEYDIVHETYLIDTDVFNTMGYREGRTSFENLVRLRLCYEGEAILRIPPKSSGFKRTATDFGFRFMQACAVPIARA